MLREIPTGSIETFAATKLLKVKMFLLFEAFGRVGDVLRGNVENSSTHTGKPGKVERGKRNSFVALRIFLCDIVD